MNGYSFSTDGAHPRSRGEHVLLKEAGEMVAGSSPLARGAHGSSWTFPHHLGLIPARAGSTMNASPRPPRRGAHPRSRGEHPVRRYSIPRRKGSSPLARGALITLILPTGTPGLIPARAGSTQMRRSPCAVLRAHPRSRGEHFSTALKTQLTAGSSPLARGARQLIRKGDPAHGLIPARAGSTRLDYGS